jgi:hypothetical protein
MTIRAVTEPSVEEIVAWFEREHATLDDVSATTISTGYVYALIASWRERGEALKGLVDRLDEIAAHPEFKSVWTLHAVHGGDYRGPNWVDALERARSALCLAAHNPDYRCFQSRT